MTRRRPTSLTLPMTSGRERGREVDLSIYVWERESPWPTVSGSTIKKEGREGVLPPPPLLERFGVLPKRPWEG